MVSVLRNKDATTAIATIDLATTGSVSHLTTPSSTVIGTIDIKANRVYFTASQQLKDELFYFDLSQKQLYTLSTPGIGSYFINSNFNKLNWSTFTADGYQLQQTDNSLSKWRLVSMEAFAQNKTGIVTDSLQVSDQLMTTPLKNPVAQPYHKLTRPFNFHSWRPNYSDPEFSFTIYGNNILNTIETQLYYVYNENDRTHTAGGAITYGGFSLYNPGL
ncbi:hypothetical protein KRR40_07235 [Niabella defluvii]|nr:hypothetical protein KRR40_07235 [Niabella sp. I65]